MKQDLDNYLIRKKKRRRAISIVIITLFTAVCAMLLKECSQSFDEPYNKGYQPVDKVSLADKPEVLP